MSSSEPPREPVRDLSLPPVSPDIIEQDHPDEIDNIVPTRGYHMLPLVGLGGSAGSIAALQRFFTLMPPDSGMAFVVVVHLAPEHDSVLPQMLQRTTKMPVAAATDGAEVHPNHVYVIPPGKHLMVTDGHLRLTELPAERGRRVAVDLFFRTLADTHGPHAMAIVLSGADSDGTVGIKRIKERGGLTVSQEPDEAEHGGMPRSAIGTGMVDWILKIEEMPRRLVEYRQRERRLRLPPEDGPQPAASTALAADSESALREVLAFVRSRTGRDFSYYKRATLLRRISRRMQVTGTDDLPAYLAYLRTHPGESAALVQDILISVTNFFRDRDAFATLERQIPDLFKGKGPNDSLRVWVAACATGEEAYSLAIMLNEHARSIDGAPSVQVFATDLDEDAIQLARDGIYPVTIAADVSEERLRRYFIKEHRGYRVRREIRETVLFAMHDLLKDSPFSRLDLVSCRNLLIYLNRDAQKRALDIFHFALRPEGRLFLGSSESVEDGNTLFMVVDKKHRVYAPRPTPRSALPVPSGPGTIALALETQERARERPAIPPPSPGLVSAILRSDRKEPLAASWGELHYKLIERFAGPSIVVNQEHEIVHLSASAGRFLQLSGGEPTRNLLRLVHPMMRIELRAALYRAAQSSGAAEAHRVPTELEGRRCAVDIRVEPAGDLAPDFFLVLFTVQETPAQPEDAAEPRAEPEPLVRQMERELEEVKTNLRDVVEQSEASNEELKASNEELQAMNEELRSATEELETSREELQSINEELTTVNQELKNKVDELGHANSDLHNLMASTAIATVFLDRDLRITRYTPSAVTLFNFIPTDLGRPLSDLTRQRDYGPIETDAMRALQHLLPAERELHVNERWFLARTLPYRTTDDRIAGVVLTFVDITERKHAEQQLRTTREQIEVRVRERTGALDTANETLRAEATERARAESTRLDMARQLMTAQEEERARISRGLHDEVGQQLAALILDLKAVEVGAAKSSDPAKLRAMRAAAEKLAREIHELAVELRPTALDDLGLLRALGNYIEDWAARNKVKIQFSHAGLEPGRLPAPLETTLYRIVCEALNNVTKHSKTKQASVRLERRGDEVRAVIEDHGVGFDPKKAGGPKKLGLVGMRERAILLGGDVQVVSHPGDGTTVTVRLPIELKDEGR